jgi:hypothetical protein
MRDGLNSTLNKRGDRMKITIDEISNGKNELYDMVRKFGITDLRLSKTEKLIRSACLIERDIPVCQYRGVTL